MKKKFFVPAAIAALMGVGAYFGHANATPDNASDLLLANAEALADDNENPTKKECYGGPDECLRVTTSPGHVHIYYMPTPEK